MTMFPFGNRPRSGYAGTDPAILNRVLSTYCDYPMPSPHVSTQTDPPLPRFALLDDRPGLLARVWGTITGRIG